MDNMPVRSCLHGFRKALLSAFLVAPVLLQYPESRLVTSAKSLSHYRMGPPSYKLVYNPI